MAISTSQRSSLIFREIGNWCFKDKIVGWLKSERGTLLSGTSLVRAPCDSWNQTFKQVIHQRQFPWLWRTPEGERRENEGRTTSTPSLTRRGAERHQWWWKMFGFGTGGGGREGGEAGQTSYWQLTRFALKHYRWSLYWLAQPVSDSISQTRNLVH